MLQVDGDPFAEAPDPPAVLADTLGSLARLGADGDVTAAAVLRALPSVEAKLRPRLDKDHPQIVALLEGQRAAEQVWALHAEHHGHGNAKACAACCWRSCATCASCSILLARQLARMRGSRTHRPTSNARWRSSRATSTRRSPTASASGS